ncbi:unnamed protein product [Umbelopsis ramanniana]
MDDGHLHYLESQNEEKIHGLSAKVAILKNITGKIGDEIRTGNSLLDTMVSEESPASSGQFLIRQPKSKKFCNTLCSIY